MSNTETDIAGDLTVVGIRLLQAGKMSQAEFHFRKALNMAPEFPDAHLALGCCLHAQGKYQQAIDTYDFALTASPQLVAAWNNRATTLMEIGNFAEAAENFSHALKLAPGLHDARVALATCYQALAKVDDALSTCEEILAVAPNHAEAHWNKSLLLLLLGRYEEGWKEYEWRWKKRNFTSPVRNFAQPRWNGECVRDKTILIHAEQGFGDTIQFCRYVPLVAALGAKVIFECHPPLVSLMETLAVPMQVVRLGEQLPHFDLHVPLLSLPLLFGTTIDTIPNSTPYLTPPGGAPQFSAFATPAVKIGLCWAGKSYPDPRRSCPIETLAPLAEIRNVSWYSLQVGWEKELPFPMHNYTRNLRTFADTAALISKLDLVITIDTAVAHLSGALGKSTLVTLPHAPDWRWMLERDDSPWYRSMRLFRQARPNRWDDVIKNVEQFLNKKLL